MTPDSKAAPSRTIHLSPANKMADDNKPAPVFIIRERVPEAAIYWRLARWLPGHMHYPALMSACDVEANATLTKRLGPIRRSGTWEPSRIPLPHPLAAAPRSAVSSDTAVGLEGSGQTNVGRACRCVTSRVLKLDATRRFRWRKRRSKSPPRDQSGMAAGNSPVFPFTRQAVEAATKA
jgi:hypothetical protein